MAQTIILPEYNQVENRAAEIREDIAAVKTTTDAANLAANEAKIAALEAKTAAENIPETDLSNVADKTDVATLKTAIENIKPGGGGDTGVVEDKVDTLTEIFAATAIPGACIVDLSLNARGSSYELPPTARELDELLEGATIAVSVPGLINPIKISVSSLTHFKKRLLVPASDDKAVQGYVTLKLGASATCAYGSAKIPVTIQGGTRRDVSVTTSALDGEVVEVCRIQPWNSTAAGAGASFIGTRITNASGTKFHIGGYAADGSWVDQSMTSVTIYDCPKDSDGNPLAPVARVIANGGSENAVPIEQRLAALRNMVEADIEIVGDTASIAGNKAMRYDPCFFKTTMGYLDIPRFDADGNVASVDRVYCCIKWICDIQADADYHRAPLFTRYELQNDGSYLEYPLRYGFIARYAIQNQNLNVGNKSVAMIQFKSDGSNEVGNTRDGFLGRCKAANQARVKITVPGEDPIEIAGNSDARLWSMVNLAEITFLQWMAYLYFGNNAQASLRGISTDNAAAKAQQANGTTDYIFNQGIMTGGESTLSASHQIIFLGIEGGLWSAPGWMFPDWSAVWKRTTRTDSTGVIVSEETDHFYLFCQDRAAFAPLSSDDAALLASGYRRVAFQPTTAGSGNRTRVGYDESAIMRDAFLPSASTAEPNISIGSADYQWNGAFPAVIAAYSATTKYALNSYVAQGGKIYKCVQAQTAAEPFDESKWELQADAAIERANWYMVALGTYRTHGLGLGPFCIYAHNALGTSNGAYCRARPSLQPLILDER